MYTYSELRKLIRTGYAPLIAVESSKSAEQLCREAGVSAIQLLRPFCVENNINCTIPFESRSVQVTDITFKLEYISFMKHMDTEDIEEELLNSANIQKPQMDEIHSMISKLDDVSVQYQTDQPWILDFLSTLLDCCRFGESDLLDHPLAILLVVSSNDPDPIHRFDELAQKVLSRKCFAQQTFSQTIPFFYILVHSNDSPINADEIFYSMKSSFAASQCELIHINSLPESQKRVTSPIPPSFSLPSKACIRCSDGDLQEIQTAMHSILTRGVLPSLIKRITSYTQDIINDRRGIANTLFGWFKTSSSTNLLNTSGSDEVITLYNDTSMEFKIRFIADMAFLLEEYDTAIEYYKMLIDDYRGYNSYFEMAQVSYLISMSFFLLGGKPSSGGIQIRDVFYYAQQACKLYQSSEVPYAKYDSALSAMLSVVMLSCQEIARKSRVYSATDFITVLENTFAPKSILTSVLGAWVSILRSSLQQRKNVFQFVLAALEFKKKSLLHHALWCDLHAWHFCFHHHWHYLQMYLAYDIQTLLLQIPDARHEAIQQIQKHVYTINNPHTRLDTESAIPNFLPIFTKMQDSEIAPMLETLSIPLIFPESIELRVQQNTGEDVQQWSLLQPRGEDVYEPLIEGLLKSGLSCSREDGLTKVHLHQPLAVCLTIQNPFNEVLEFQQVTLKVSEPTSVTLSPQPCVLQPLEVKTLSLIVTPIVATSLTIEAVTFTLTSSLTFTHTLAFPKRRLNHTLQQRRQPTYSAPQKLSVKVVGSDCAVHHTIEGFQATHVVSEVIPLQVTVTNRGNVPIQEVYLVTERDALVGMSTPVNTSYSDVHVYSLYQSALQAGAEHVSTCVYHVTKEETPCIFRYLLVLRTQDEWSVIRGENVFEVKPLLRVSLMKLPYENNRFYRCVVNNIHEEQTVEKITVISSCSVVSMHPAVISDCASGCTHACVMEIKTEPTEDSSRVLLDVCYQKVMEILQKQDALERQMDLLNPSESVDCRFIRFVWSFRDEEEQDRLGYIMKRIE